MQKEKKRMRGALNVFLSLVLAAGLLPVMPAVAAADESAAAELGSVHVTVENTTFTAPVDNEAPAWTGKLVDTTVALAADSTMMSCVQAAITSAGKTYEMKNSTYMKSIAGLGEFDGGDQSGWMGTLNDWFTNQTFDAFTVANGKLAAGDEIRVMYSCIGYGADLGADWNNTDKSLTAIEFSAGTLDKEFSASEHAYTLTVPQGTASVKVLPTAANKNYQVRTFVGDTQYKRTADVPVADGATITVKSGYANMDAANDAADTFAYTFTVKVGGEAPEPAAKVIDSGTLNNATWTVYDNGVLKLGKIDGTDGKMRNSSQWSTPAYSKKYGKSITSIVIDEGITYLGDYVLAQLTSATSISFPVSLTDMGENALYGCSSVTEYHCAEGGSLVIDGNYLLKDNGATLLKILDPTLVTGAVTLPATVTAIGDQFSGMTAMTSIELPAGLKKMGAYAFARCTGLTEVTVPCNLTDDDYAFSGCKNLTSITFSEGVTSVINGGIGYLKNLTTINFPSTLTELSGGAISKSVTTITFAEGCAYSFENGVITKTTDAGKEIVKVLSSASVVDENGVLTIPEGVTAIGASAYERRSDIKSIVFPSTLKTIGDSAFASCANLTGELVIPEGVTTLDRFAFGSTGITKAVIPGGVTEIGNQLFDFCESLKELVVGSNVSDSICNSCPALETITVTEGVTAITNNAFRTSEAEDHKALTTLNLPASLQQLEASALKNNMALTTINCAEGGNFAFADNLLTKPADHALVYALPLISGAFSVPEGTTEIGSSAFINCANITSVSFPEGLKTIGAKAFEEGRDGNLAGELVIPSTVTFIGDYAFSNCTGLTKVNCLDPATPTDITYGARVFQSCTGVTEVHLPQGLTAYDGLFYSATKVTVLDIPETATSLGGNGQNFRGMTALRSVSMPGVTALGYMDFYGNKNLETIDLSGAASIGDTSFNNMGVNMKELYLGKQLTSFGNNTMTYPTFIYYAGSQEDWGKIEFGSKVAERIEQYGTTVVYNYKAASEPLTVVSQPANISAYKGLVSQEATFEVAIPEGATAYYYWYDASGACVSAGTSASFTTASSSLGDFTYYCVAKAIAADGTVSTVKSAPFTLTVSELTGIFQGSGTEEDPYLLKTAQDLAYLSSIVNSGESYEGSVFKMAADIELPAGWTPIGATKDGSDDIQRGKNLNAFRGTFDGDGHLLTVPAGEKPLFNYVWGATIKNLNIYGSQINGFGLIDKWVGIGLSGTGVTISGVTLKTGTSTLKSGLLGGVITTNPYGGVPAVYVASISDCTIEEGVTIGYTGTEDMIGSFAGRFQGTMENCVSHATVKGTNFVGGIIGTRDNALGTCSVSGCTFDGTVEASGKNAGGIVGGGYENSTAPNGIHVSVNDCISSGTISGKENVGGILGGDEYIAQAWNGYTFKNNTFNGTVSGQTNVGAIIGFYDSLNKWDDISGNTFTHDCGADKGFGKVWIVDTNCANPTAIEGVKYVNTETSVAGCPEVTGCAWKTGFNRTDDPLGADADALCKMQTYFEVSTAVAADGSGAVPAAVKVGDTVTVDVSVSANDGVAALSGTLDFDPAVFDLVGVSKGAGLSEGASFLPAEGAAETLFSFYGNEAAADAEGGIVVATATLKALKAADAATIGVKDATAAIAGDSLDYAATMGGVATIDVLADATLGDANGNGRVNIVDAQVVYDMAIGAYGEGYSALTLPASWTRATLLWAANVNDDDAIDAVDAFAIQRFVHYGAWA